MILVIGGFSQGKLEFVKNKYGISDECIFDSVIPKEEEIRRFDKQFIVIDNYHLFVKQCLTDNEDAYTKTEQLLKKHKDVIIISDEIGNGIVPVDAFERDYREKTGRILIKIANGSEEVWRIICSIGQRIK